MKANAEAACSSILMDVSTPGSPNYGNFLNQDEVKSTFYDQANTKIVEDWLSSLNIDFSTTLKGDYVSVTAPVHALEQLLNAQFHDFTSAVAKRSIKRTQGLLLPREITDAIDFVGHTITFPAAKAKFGVHKVNARQSGNVNPALLTQYYGIKNTVVKSSKATQALFEALGQDFSPQDLSMFQQNNNLNNNAVSNVIGPNDPTQCAADPNNCGEANLDVQYIMAIAQDAPTTYWSIDANSQDPFLDWAVALGNTTNPPLVHSISYGSIATEDPQQDMTRFNTEVCVLGTQGVTVSVSSGDDGVANFEARNDPSQCGFNPSFPATSPYVTSVGATQGPEFGSPEIACSSNTNGLITTGGGFSIFFSRPAYQNAAVQNYLQNGPNLPPLSQFNSQGRGYPDVAILGHNYEVVIGGQTYIESGTSASSPVFAGMVTLINDYRISNGKSPLGFLNPALYKLGASSTNVFNDITSGENNCCAGEPGQQVCCQYGFNATTGWDPLTGFGSVNFPALLKALGSL
jgi:tripeptidyl-peptidase-1